MPNDEMIYYRSGKALDGFRVKDARRFVSKTDPKETLYSTWSGKWVLHRRSLFDFATQDSQEIAGLDAACWLLENGYASDVNDPEEHDRGE